MQHVDPMAPRPHSKGVEDDQPGAESRSVPSLRRMSTQSSLPCSDAGAGLLVFVTHATWERPVPFDIPVMSTVKHLTHQVTQRLHAAPGTVRLLLRGQKLDSGSYLADLGVCPQSVLAATSAFDACALGELIGSATDATSFLLDMKNPQHIPAVTAAMRCVRETVSAGPSMPLAQLVDSGVVPLIVEAIRQIQDNALQLEAAWCLTNICGGETEHCMHVVEVGAVPLLVTQLQCGDADVVEQAVWTLANIAADLRDAVLRAGATDHIVEAAAQHSGRLLLLRHATRCCMSLVGGKCKPAADVLRSALRHALRFAHNLDAEVQEYALCTLARVPTREGLDLCIDEMRRAQMGLGEFAYLLQPRLERRVPVLRWIGSFVAGTPDQTQVVVDAGLLRRFEGLVTDSDESVRTRLFRALSNVAAGTPAQQTYIFGLPYLPSALLAAVQDTRRVACEAAYVMSNLSSGDQLAPDNAARIVGWDAFEYLRSELVSRLQEGHLCLLSKKLSIAARTVLRVYKALKNTVDPHLEPLKGAVDLIAAHCDGSLKEDAAALL
eukprot:TRINITY_DN563_c0_g2_i1.p1 TRINITY_DN563_c0_g2~~TRINITY_DN563_c0_g2_i1.p1  ORF type:complete len:551 (+),score=35.12 TRINITY_DN563_c0_g2_i1:64-1716(+)